MLLLAARCPVTAESTRLTIPKPTITHFRSPTITQLSRSHPLFLLAPCPDLTAPPCDPQPNHQVFRSLGKDPREVQEEIDMFRLCTLTLGHRGQLVDDHPDAASAVDSASLSATPSSPGLADTAEHNATIAQQQHQHQQQALSKKKGWIKQLKSDATAKTTVDAVQQLPLSEKRSLTQFHLR